MFVQLQKVGTTDSGSVGRGGWRVPILLVTAGAVATYIGQAIAWLVVSLILDVPEGTDSIALSTSLWLLLVGVPLAVLWFGGQRRRWFAVGGVAVVGVLLGTMLVSADRPVRDPDALRRLEATARKSPVTIYYPGPVFHGWHLDDEGIDHGEDSAVDPSATSLGAADSVFLGYGTTCTTSTVGTCGPRYEIDLHRFRAADVEDRCVHRLPATRGLAPMELEGQGVVIFVDELVVTFPDQPDEALVTATAQALRPVGESSTSPGDLPAPPAPVAELIGQCLARPRG